jgi:hypothetical protein
MAGGNSGLTPRVIVVGDPGSELVREMVRLAREYEVEAVPCDDVYAAVAQAARSAARRVMIVGTVRELTREESRLFPVAAANAVRCCCLIERGAMVGRAALLSALRAGAAIAGETREVRAVLEDWLAGRRPDPRNVFDDDVRATPAELSALLGHETDA